MIGYIGAMPQLYETPGRLSAAQLPSARRLWHSRQEMLLDSWSLGGAVLLGLEAMPTGDNPTRPAPPGPHEKVWSGLTPLTPLSMNFKQIA